MYNYSFGNSEMSMMAAIQNRFVIKTPDFKRMFFLLQKYFVWRHKGLIYKIIDDNSRYKS